MADEAKKALQVEVMAVKQKWGDEIKLSKAKDGPLAPLPISIQRTIELPADASAYDVVELKLLAYARKIAERVDAQWRSELKARGLGKGWLLEKMLSWCESKFVDLLNLEPACLDMYMGDDANGMTIRRFALIELVDESAAVEPAAEEEEGDSEGEEESDDDEAPKIADPTVRKERERLERIKVAAEAEADRQWREERRREYESVGEDDRPKPISKKDSAPVTRKEKQGTRTSKTGAKANKFDAEAAGKKANKKNGLVH